MVSPAAQQDALKGRNEYVPVLYHLANDPEHMKLRAVNEQDVTHLYTTIVEMERKKQDYPARLVLIATWRSALRWKWSNRVSDPEPQSRFDTV
jgi:hypothetical protein